MRLFSSVEKKEKAAEGKRSDFGSFMFWKLGSRNRNIFTFFPPRRVDILEDHPSKQDHVGDIYSPSEESSSREESSSQLESSSKEESSSIEESLYKESKLKEPGPKRALPIEPGPKESPRETKKKKHARKEPSSPLKSYETISGNYILTRGWEGNNMSVFRIRHK